MTDNLQLEVTELKELINAMDKQIGRNLAVISVQKSALDLGVQMQQLTAFDMEELCLAVLAQRTGMATELAQKYMKKFEKKNQPSLDAQQSIPFPEPGLTFPPEPEPTASATGLPLPSTSICLVQEQTDSPLTNSPTSP